jgi:hypothetical protein
VTYHDRTRTLTLRRLNAVSPEPLQGVGGLNTEEITSAGEYPTWRKDGKEIVYLDGNRIWSLPVDTSSGEVRAGVPEALFSVRPVGRVLDVSPLAVSRDGSRFYFPQAIEQPDSDVIHARIGWLTPRK